MIKLNFDNKGQASAEFIFITLIVIFIIGGMVSLISSTQNQVTTGNVGGERILGENIAETINAVYIGGNGYSIDMDLRTMNKELSTSSNPFKFTATVSNTGGNGVVTVLTGRNNINVNLIPKNFSGNLTLNNNNVYNVTNINDTIQITQET